MEDVVKSIMRKDVVGWWEKQIRQLGIPDWVQDIVVSLHPGDLQSDKRRQALVDNFEADNIDWYRGVDANWKEFMRLRGIRINGATEYEYQESIHFPYASTVRLFRRNGIAVMADGDLLVEPPWYAGRNVVLMDLIAPKWREMVRQGLLRAAYLGASVSSDNIGSINGHFDRWNQKEFLRYLQGRFSQRAIMNMCRGSAEYFDFGRYVHERIVRLRREGRMDPELMDDDICREWIRFQYLANLSVWGNLVRDIKAEGRRLGRPVPAVWGNQCRDFCVGLTPYVVAQSRLVDVVWIETTMQQPFRPSGNGAAALVYKVGRAAGGYAKPVWAIQWPNIAPNSGRICEQIAMAEGAAQGGIAYTPAAWINMPKGGEGYRDMQSFLARWRPLFPRRQAYAQVALAYPMSAFFWRGYKDIKPDDYGMVDQYMVDEKHLSLDRYMSVMARVLEELHIPYEVVIFGQPDIWNDGGTFKRLKRYTALILPGMECLSRQQEAVIQAFLKRGGMVVSCGPFGVRDENFRVRQPPAWPRSAGKRWLSIPDAVIKEYFVRRAQGRDLPAVKALEKIVNNALQPSSVITMQAPRTVWVSPWLQEEGRRLSIHLVNYDLAIDHNMLEAFKKAAEAEGKGNLDPERIMEKALLKPGYARLRPVHDIRLQVRVPPQVRFDRVRLIPYGGKPIDLACRVVSDGSVEVIIPRLQIWGMLVFTFGQELEAACALSQAQRAGDRMQVATGQEAPASVQQAIHEAEQALACRNMDAACQKALKAKAAAESGLKVQIDSLLAAEKKSHAIERDLYQGARLALNFGADKPFHGWKHFGADMIYNAKRGYGWESDPKAKLLKNKAGDPLHASALAGQGEARLRVDLPAGHYEIIVLSGESDGRAGARNWVGVGRVWRLLGERLLPGRTSCRAFIAKAADGALILHFYGTGNSPDQASHDDYPDWCIAGMVIKPVADRQRCESGLEKGALKAWNIIGPFNDSACRGMDKQFPRQFADNQSCHRDCNGEARYWKPWVAQSTQGFAPVPLHDFCQPGEAVVYASTRVFVPEAQKALLWFGSTGLGVVWLNGQQAARDEVMAGLQADEISAPLKLKKGWNDFLVRICGWWGNRWFFAASLTTTGGRAIKGLGCRPRVIKR